MSHTETSPDLGGLPQRVLDGQKLYSGIDFQHPYTADPDRVETTDLNQAQVISSEQRNRPDRHTVMLDLDVPATLIPSSTPGHSHLYVEVTVPWAKYQQLLEVLADCGIIEPGYMAVSYKRGATHLRLPWVHKPATQDPGVSYPGPPF